MSRIGVQYLLSNVCEELFTLGGRLQDVEKIIFSLESSADLKSNQVNLQDLDLIIQQINDLARAIRVVSRVELDDAMLSTTALGDTLHLNDLRQRLLGLSQDRLLSAPVPTEDVMFF